MGTFVLIFGSLIGIILIFTKIEVGFYHTLEFSRNNVLMGLSTITLSVFWWILCNWLSEILVNSKKKINLLEELKNKLK